MPKFVLWFEFEEILILRLNNLHCLIQQFMIVSNERAAIARIRIRKLTAWVELLAGCELFRASRCGRVAVSL